MNGCLEHTCKVYFQQMQFYYFVVIMTTKLVVLKQGCPTKNIVYSQGQHQIMDFF